jgi:putative hydrolase of the HAD superfamily
LETLLFDLGNVLVHFSHDRMCRQMAEVCGTTTAELRSQLIDSGLMWDFERGRVSAGELIARLESSLARSIDAERLATAASDIFTLNAEILPVLAAARRRGLRLVLLSNTSPWHYDWVRTRWDVLEFFDRLVLSYEAGAIKPEAPVFEAALRAIGCPPGACFYTDDIAAYVARGREFGLQAEVFTSVPELRAQLATRGLELE